ncbi:hypothetical protein RJD39_12840 [Vibrio scophthalmi]|uniref:Uncharacterized protein n=1 Tax=Vibrio scophthalmi TaxID=45658 RepID=A0A1E3WJ71_9VIBR|nr:hypothetical protein [Vibrio scophthalmi]ODS09829.1 hypothetical protein VSF3289_00060 [Vibrio scophthalmi]
MTTKRPQSTIITAMLILASLFLTPVSNANILSELKNTPATKYDIISTKIELMSVMLTQLLKEQAKGNIEDIEVNPILNDGIGFTFAITAPTKALTTEVCSNMKVHFEGNRLTLDDMKNLVSGLTDKEYQQLHDSFRLDVKLISEDNSNLEFLCK